MAMPEIQRLREGIKAVRYLEGIHYGDCRLWLDDGVPCDCTATADVEALLKWVQDADALLGELQGPEDDGR